MISPLRLRLRPPLLRACTRAARALGAICALALLAGCPPKPMPKVHSGATVKEAELPEGHDALIAYADAQQAKQNYVAMQNGLVALDKALEQAPTDYAALWRGARASSWLAEEAADKGRKADDARRGLEYARGAVKADPSRVEGQYYLGINLGQLATTKTVGAYGMVPEVVKAAKAAAAADERFDHAGPLRLLGAVYAKAPAWPVSVGDTEEGVRHLKRATELAGDYPLNFLFYGDALLADGNLDEAVRAYRRVLAAQPVPEWSYRLNGWQRDAEEGLRKIAKKQGKPVSTTSAGAPF